jgi:hypothetical protein
MNSRRFIVGAGEEGRRDGKAERSGCLQVDAGDELCRKLDWQVARLAPSQNSSDEIGRSTLTIRIVHSVADKSTGFDELFLTGDGRESQGSRQFRYAPNLISEQEVAQDDRRARSSVLENFESGT